jgi:hypothetical protein
MDAFEQPLSVRVGHGPDGSVTYSVDAPPEALPAVSKRDLERAWYSAREAALAQNWSVVRGFCFMRPDGTHTDLALADPDARCWVGAVDRTVGIANGYGMSLCLRLLALVELLTRARWALPLLRLEPDGAELHPALLRTAASVALTSDARFDETSFRLRLAQFADGFRLEQPDTASRLTGARA